MKESLKITILDIVAVITIPLIGIIGYLINDKIDTSNLVLEKIRKGINGANIRFENHEGRISSNTRASTDNTKRIIILERKQ
jgi:hypothetical protein